MKNETLKHLCQSGAFDLFKEVCNQIEEPEIHKGEDLEYQLGLRDGYRGFRQELFDLITKLASE